MENKNILDNMPNKSPDEITLPKECMPLENENSPPKNENLTKDKNMFTELFGINLPVVDNEDIYTRYQLIPDPYLTGRIDGLTADRARLEAEKARLNARIATLDGQVNTLNREKSQALNDKQFLQTRKGELEIENSTLRSRISALEDQKAQLERDKSGLNSRIRSLEEDLRKSREKEKTGWNYLPIIGTFNIK